MAISNHITWSQFLCLANSFLVACSFPSLSICSLDTELLHTLTRIHKQKKSPSLIEIL